MDNFPRVDIMVAVIVSLGAMNLGVLHKFTTCTIMLRRYS